MGYASRQNEAANQRKVLIICSTKEVEADFAAFSFRTVKALEIMQKFIDSSCQLDEEAPDFEAKCNR